MGTHFFVIHYYRLRRKMYPTTFDVMNEYDPCNPGYDTFCGDGLAGVVFLYDPRSPAFDPRQDPLFCAPYDPFSFGKTTTSLADGWRSHTRKHPRSKSAPGLLSKRRQRGRKVARPTPINAAYDPRSPAYDPLVDACLNYEPLE